MKSLNKMLAEITEVARDKYYNSDVRVYNQKTGKLLRVEPANVKPDGKKKRGKK